MQRARDFTEALFAAREIEKLVGWWLMRAGYRLLPVYDYSGLGSDKAPKLSAIHQLDSLVTPDLLTAKDGRAAWLEVKHKQRADMHRNTHTIETGIDLRLWRQYEHVKRVTGLPVWLVFVHEAENEVRTGEIAKLDPIKRIYDGPKMGRGGMVFFPYEQLVRLASLSSIREEYVRS